MTNLKKLFTVLLCLLTAGSLPAMASNRWKINADGGITWHISEDIPTLFIIYSLIQDDELLS